MTTAESVRVVPLAPVTVSAGCGSLMSGASEERESGDITHTHTVSIAAGFPDTRHRQRESGLLGNDIHEAMEHEFWGELSMSYGKLLQL